MPQIRVFVPNIYKNGNLLNIDILRMIIVMIFLIFLIIEIIKKFDRFKEDFLDTIRMSMFYSFFIIIVFLINVINRFVFLNQDDSSFYDLKYSTYLVLFDFLLRIPFIVQNNIMKCFI